MSGISPGLQAALAESPHYDFVSSHLSTLLSSYPPPFIFIHDPESSRLTASVVRSTLRDLGSEPLHVDAGVSQLKYACVNAVASFSARILYDTALNALAGWIPDWRDGATNWHGSGSEARRFNESFDAFVHGIQAVVAEATAAGASAKVNGTARGKGKEREREAAQSCRLVLVVERAERLKDNLPELLVPLTRLAELSQVDITTIFISEVQWQDFRPPLRASPEPYYIDVPFLSKQDTQDLLASAYSSPTHGASSSAVDLDAYHPALKPLYADFIALLYSTCNPFTHDPTELAYIAAARWPGFVQPVLDAYRRLLSEDDIASSPRDEDGDDHRNQRELQPPTEDTRLRLLRLFTPSLTAALESLYPRLSNATRWARVHAPPPDLLYVPPGAAKDALAAQVATNAARLNTQGDRPTEAGIDALPRMAKFVLVAAFLASTNPARSDLRMFGRGPDERAKRRKHKGGTPRRPKNGTTGTAVKIPQRLLGPTAFPLDRLIAILGVLLEENDADVRPVAPQYTLPGEYTEMEIARVALYANIVELGSMRLLVRTTPPDHLDRVPMFKCGIGYELAIKVAKSIGIILNDLVYEVV